MALYLVAMRLPKMQFVGTTAVFFMVLNLFKVPFMVNLGLITAQSFEFNLMLAPAVLLGAFAGRWLLIRINQRLFDEPGARLERHRRISVDPLIVKISVRISRRWCAADWARCTPQFGRNWLRRIRHSDRAPRACRAHC